MGVADFSELINIIDEFEKESKDELFPTFDDAYRHYTSDEMLNNLRMFGRILRMKGLKFGKKWLN